MGGVVGQLLFVMDHVTPAWAIWAGLGLAIGTALLFAWLPAQQAARLEPVLALGRR